MNIFVSSECPKESARFLDNKRRIKMLLESVQLLCGAVILNGGTAPYRLSHKNHPVMNWTRISRSNYRWLLSHAIELVRLYKGKTGKTHGSAKHLYVLYKFQHFIPTGSLSPFINCARNKSKGIDYTNVNHVPTAYQLYLNDRWEGDKYEPVWD